MAPTYRGDDAALILGHTDYLSELMIDNYVYVLIDHFYSPDNSFGRVLRLLVNRRDAPTEFPTYSLVGTEELGFDKVQTR